MSAQWDRFRALLVAEIHRYARVDEGGIGQVLQLECLRVAALDRIDESLRTLRLEARAVDEELHGPFDSDRPEHRAQLVANVHRVRAGKDPGVDVERGHLRRTGEIERIAAAYRVHARL